MLPLFIEPPSWERSVKRHLNPQGRTQQQGHRSTRCTADPKGGVGGYTLSLSVWLYVCLFVPLSSSPFLILSISPFLHLFLSPSFFLPSPLVLPSFIPHPTTSGATFLSPPFRPFILDSKHSPNFRIPYDTRWQSCCPHKFLAAEKVGQFRCRRRL